MDYPNVSAGRRSGYSENPRPSNEPPRRALLPTPSAVSKSTTNNSMKYSRVVSLPPNSSRPGLLPTPGVPNLPVVIPNPIQTQLPRSLVNESPHRTLQPASSASQNPPARPFVDEAARRGLLPPPGPSQFPPPSQNKRDDRREAALVRGQNRIICSLCNHQEFSTYESAMAHLTSSMHLYNLSKGPRSQTSDTPLRQEPQEIFPGPQIDLRNLPEGIETTPSKNYFLCTICNSKIRPNEISSHVSSVDHRAGGRTVILRLADNDFRCIICNEDVHDHIELRKHLAGTDHMTKRTLMMDPKLIALKRSYGLPEGIERTKTDDWFWCSICSCPLKATQMSALTHVEKESHLEKLAIRRGKKVDHLEKSGFSDGRQDPDAGKSSSFDSYQVPSALLKAMDEAYQVRELDHDMMRAAPSRLAGGRSEGNRNPSNILQSSFMRRDNSETSREDYEKYYNFPTLFPQSSVGDGTYSALQDQDHDMRLASRSAGRPGENRHPPNNYPSSSGARGETSLPRRDYEGMRPPAFASRSRAEGLDNSQNNFKSWSLKNMNDMLRPSTSSQSRPEGYQNPQNNLPSSLSREIDNPTRPSTFTPRSTLEGHQKPQNNFPSSSSRDIDDSTRALTYTPRSAPEGHQKPENNFPRSSLREPSSFPLASQATSNPQPIPRAGATENHEQIPGINNFCDICNVTIAGGFWNIVNHRNSQEHKDKEALGPSGPAPVDDLPDGIERLRTRKFCICLICGCKINPYITPATHAARPGHKSKGGNVFVRVGDSYFHCTACGITLTHWKRALTHVKRLRHIERKMDAEVNKLPPRLPRPMYGRSPRPDEKFARRMLPDGIQRVITKGRHQRFVCTICGEKLWRKESMTEHVKSYDHMMSGTNFVRRVGRFRFKCTICNYSLPSTIKTLKHVRSAEHWAMKAKKFPEETEKLKILYKLPEGIVKCYDSRRYWCHLCVRIMGRKFDEVKEHIQGDRHVENLKNYRENPKSADWTVRDVPKELKNFEIEDDEWDDELEDEELGNDSVTKGEETSDFEEDYGEEKEQMEEKFLEGRSRESPTFASDAKFSKDFDISYGRSLSSLKDRDELYQAREGVYDIMTASAPPGSEIEEYSHLPNDLRIVISTEGDVERKKVSGPGREVVKENLWQDDYKMEDGKKFGELFSDERRGRETAQSSMLAGGSKSETNYNRSYPQPLSSSRGRDEVSRYRNRSRDREHEGVGPTSASRSRSEGHHNPSNLAQSLSLKGREERERKKSSISGDIEIMNWKRDENSQNTYRRENIEKSRELLSDGRDRRNRETGKSSTYGSRHKRDRDEASRDRRRSRERDREVTRTTSTSDSRSRGYHKTASDSKSYSSRDRERDRNKTSNSERDTARKISRDDHRSARGEARTSRESDSQRVSIDDFIVTDECYGSDDGRADEGNERGARTTRPGIKSRNYHNPAKFPGGIVQVAGENFLLCLFCNLKMAPDTLENHLATAEHRKKMEKIIVRFSENDHKCKICNLRLYHATSVNFHLQGKIHRKNTRTGNADGKGNEDSHSPSRENKRRRVDGGRKIF